MKNEKLLKEIIKTTENTIADYIYQLRILKNSLLKCNYIIQVNATTITLNKNNIVAFEITKYPYQFSKKAVKEILNTNFYDTNNNAITPHIFSAKHWYTSQLKKALNTHYQARKLLM